MFFFAPLVRRSRSDLSGGKKRSRTGDSTKATGDIVVFFSQISQWEPDSATSCLGLHCNVSPEETFSLFLFLFFLRVNNVTPSGMFRTLFGSMESANKALSRATGGSLTEDERGSGSSATGFTEHTSRQIDTITALK